jgi:beta-glucosidase
LSYTTFRFSNLHLSAPTMSEHGRVIASANLTNTGSRAGADVAQLYLTDPAATGEPPLQLKGFSKVFLQPGQTKKVQFAVTADDASYWHSLAHSWILAPGTYTVHVGDSSSSLPLSGTFRVTRATGPQYTTVSAPDIALPGANTTVTTTFANDATVPVHDATTTLSLPDGWTAQPQGSTHFGVVNPGDSRTVTWTVGVPADASGGGATVTASTSYSGPRSPATGTATVQVAYSDLAAAFNTVGVSDDSNPAPGNFDGTGYSYSAQALASVGVTPGDPVGTSGFTWPNVSAGQQDVVTTAGQIVAVDGSGSSLSFLGAGSNGTQSGQVTVTYQDGTTSTGTITFADWYNNAAVPGCTLVVTSPHWNEPAGSTLDPGHDVSLYAASVPLTAGKQIAYITLPDNARLHVFATTVS